MSSRPSPRTRPLRSFAVAALAVGLVVGGAACSSDGESGSGDASLVPPESIIAPENTTSTTDPDATTTTLAPPVGSPDGASAALSLYNAWVANDRNAAATVAEPAAIDAIWAAVPGPYELYRGCDTGEFGTGGCLFRDRSTNHTIQIDLEKRDTGWVVTNAFYSAE